MYWAALQSLASLLKADGHLVATAALHSRYMVGSKKFFGLHPVETVEKTMQEAGCQVQRCAPISCSETCSINEGVCFVAACKGPSV